MTVQLNAVLLTFPVKCFPVVTNNFWQFSYDISACAQIAVMRTVIWEH